MSTRTSHTTNFEVYFCIITCYKWLSLFEIHHNPVNGKWRLGDDFTRYSSADYYDVGAENKYVSHYKELANDVVRYKRNFRVLCERL